MMRTPAALLLLPVWLWPGPAVAQGRPPPPLTWAMKVGQPAAGLKAGDTFEAAITVKVEDGWHVYAADEVPDGPKPLLIKLAEDSPFRGGGKLKAPEPEREMDESFGVVTPFYKADTTFTLPVAVPGNLPAGTYGLVVDVAFQACNGQICLPARTTVLKTTLSITN